MPAEVSLQAVHGSVLAAEERLLGAVERAVLAQDGVRGRAGRVNRCRHVTPLTQPAGHFTALWLTGRRGQKKYIFSRVPSPYQCCLKFYLFTPLLSG